MTNNLYNEAVKMNRRAAECKKVMAGMCFYQAEAVMARKVYADRKVARIVGILVRKGYDMSKIESLVNG